MTVCVSQIESATWRSGCSRWNSQRDEVCARARGSADGERPGQPPVVRADLVEELLFEREHALGAPVQTPAGLGGLHPPPRPIEQRLAQALLQRADLKAHRRLGDTELLRRL
jgi:hypothetical protein